MSNVSLEMYYFVSYDGALTLKISKMALNAFCHKTLHIYIYIIIIIIIYIYHYYMRESLKRIGALLQIIAPLSDPP